jgi:PhnB protein
MTMLVQPYLFFEGRCEEALDFYKAKLGAKVDMLMHFKDNPEPQNQQAPEGCGGMDVQPDKVMHCAFRIGESLVMASDGMASGKPAFQGVSLSISVKTEAEAKKLFDGLSEGGNVQMPLTKTFYSPAFGMVADKFGVSWMVVTDDPNMPKH